MAKPVAIGDLGRRVEDILNARYTEAQVKVELGVRHEFVYGDQTRVLIVKPGQRFIRGSGCLADDCEDGLRPVLHNGEKVWVRCSCDAGERWKDDRGRYVSVALDDVIFGLPPAAAAPPPAVASPASYYDADERREHEQDDMPEEPEHM